jgi:hypothetical protein
VIFDEPDTLQEVSVFDVRDQPIPLQLFRERREFVQHDASNALASQLFGNDEIDDADGIGFDVHLQHRHELADEFAEESGAGARRSAVLRGEGADRIGIGRFDRAYEELLTFHDGVNGRLRLRGSRPPNSLLSCFYSISWSGK